LSPCRPCLSAAGAIAAGQVLYNQIGKNTADESQRGSETGRFSALTTGASYDLPPAVRTPGTSGAAYPHVARQPKSHLKFHGSSFRNHDLINEKMELSE